MVSTIEIQGCYVHTINVDIIDAQKSQRLII